MKLVKPSVEIKNQETGLDGIYKQIEWAGRHCYKSLDKITEDSAKKFVDMLANNKHGAMLEHGTVYLYIEFTSPLADKNFLLYSKIKHKYSLNQYSKVVCNLIDNYKTECYITTNLRVLVENNWMEDLQYICEPTEHHVKRVTVKFTIDNGIMREFTRHRTMSFACESTRYCNYSKDKYGNEIIFIQPSWYSTTTFDSERPSEYDNESMAIYWFQRGLKDCEERYLELINRGWKPQQARAILPLATKCDLIMTGFIDDWKHFLSLRSSDYGATGAHPDASYIANKLYEQFKENNYLS